MRVNVVITPKKNEVIECDEIYLDQGTVELFRKTGRGKNIRRETIAGFKKWIRFYVLPEEKKEVKKVK